MWKNKNELTHDFSVGDERTISEEEQAESRLDRFENLNKEEQQAQLPLYRQAGSNYAAIEDGTIRSYTGLSATTQERIRRYVYVMLP